MAGACRRSRSAKSGCKPRRATEAAVATTAHAQVPAIPPAEQAAIIAAALDYAEGYYSGAPERMERALHPDLNKVHVQKLAQTGRFVVGYSTYSGLIEMTRARLGLLAPERSKIQASALSMVGDVALAAVGRAARESRWGLEGPEHPEQAGDGGAVSVRPAPTEVGAGLVLTTMGHRSDIYLTDASSRNPLALVEW